MKKPTTSTRVLVFSSTMLQRAAWEALLANQPGITVWGTAATKEDVLALYDVDQPAAVLVDFPQPSLDLLHQMANAAPNLGILCLLTTYDLPEVISLLQAGVLGCLIRDATVAGLARALIAVARGEIVLPANLAARALAALARGDIPRDNMPETLTDRESEVLILLAQGNTNKDIAQSLFLSVRTVEAHLRNIYGKLGVASRTEAALWAVRHGWSSTCNSAITSVAT